MIPRWLILLLVLCTGLAQAADPELLEPEKAFAFSARVAGPDAIEVRYVIAKGYYMYRDKFRFELEPATLAAGSGASPTGIGTRGHTLIVQDFVAAIREGRDPLVDGVEGRRSLALVLAIYRAAGIGRERREVRASRDGSACH